MTENEFNGTATGFLSLAGQTKEIKVPFHGNLLENGKMIVEGKVDLKMSEFKIEPPTAMLGTLKTGDEISIVYSLELEKAMINKQISEVKAVRGIRD
jgi:polyisoprenoid-binding protein YceI